MSGRGGGSCGWLGKAQTPPPRLLLHLQRYAWPGPTTPTPQRTVPAADSATGARAPLRQVSKGKSQCKRRSVQALQALEARCLPAVSEEVDGSLSAPGQCWTLLHRPDQLQDSADKPSRILHLPATTTTTRPRIACSRRVPRSCTLRERVGAPSSSRPPRRTARRWSFPRTHPPRIPTC